ncbi:membrane protein [Bacterioplanes sanyensis]|uniref:YoaK family protein n=1 Tax=Bacterioplanes sanyensis TaxID=1249553 RepID=UPI001676E140|nr:YoaK family protein [Bacterioplanes sanyensis]GGY44793.1 membrane protein [Bacterioplanes sanyensis]
MIYRLPRWIMLGGALLALNAGFVNSLALLSFAHQAVSHVTGTITVAASAWSTGGGWLPPLWIVFSFLLGAVISGVVVGNESLTAGRRYGVALLIEATLLAAAWWCLRQQWSAGEWLASAACGLQNAMVATYSGSVIRTTHLTGIVSDIGSWLGNRLAGRAVNRRQLLLHTILLVGFVSGAAVGSQLYALWQIDALWTAIILVTVTALIYQGWRR